MPVLPLHFLTYKYSAFSPHRPHKWKLNSILSGLPKLLVELSRQCFMKQSGGEESAIISLGGQGFTSSREEAAENPISAKAETTGGTALPKLGGS